MIIVFSVLVLAIVLVIVKKYLSASQGKPSSAGRPQLDATIKELGSIQEKILAKRAQGASEAEAVRDALKEWKQEVEPSRFGPAGSSEQSPTNIPLAERESGNWLGLDTPQDTGTEAEKLDAARANLSRMAQERLEEARAFVSETVIADVVTHLDNGESAAQAITSVFKWRLPAEARTQMGRKLEERIAAGSSTATAVRATLAEFAAAND